MYSRRGLLEAKLRYHIVWRARGTGGEFVFSSQAALAALFLTRAALEIHVATTRCLLRKNTLIVCLRARQIHARTLGSACKSLVLGQKLYRCCSMSALQLARVHTRNVQRRRRNCCDARGHQTHAPRCTPTTSTTYKTTPARASVVSQFDLMFDMVHHKKCHAQNVFSQSRLHATSASFRD